MSATRVVIASAIFVAVIALLIACVPRGQQPVDELEAGSDYLAVQTFALNGTPLDGNNQRNWTGAGVWTPAVSVPKGTEYVIVVACSNLTIAKMAYNISYPYGVSVLGAVAMGGCQQNKTVYTLTDKGITNIALNVTVNASNATGTITAFVVAK